jgi:hypothetical protein
MRRINNMIACEGLVRCGETGVSTTFNAVRERSAVKVARSVLRGPYARESMQHGQRGSLLVIARAMSNRNVVMESGTCRWTRRAASRDVTFG